MSDEKTFKYDVFISYRWIEPDLSWVRTQLEPALKNAGLEVLLDFNNFVPGRAPIVEMARAGKESKHGLCVLSPDYVKALHGWVGLESFMLRSMDPTGTESLLIPFILRRTELPPHLELIAIDWTNPANHKHEWAKLLKTLGAINPGAPPPGPVVEKRPPIFKYVSLGVVVVLLLAALIGVGYKACNKPPVPDLITLAGTVYYQQAPGSTGLIAVSGVAVSLSQDSNIPAVRTDANGKFVLQGVPANGSKDLKFEYGEVAYTMPYQANGSYAVIPVDIDPARKFVHTPWVDENRQPCLPEYGLRAKYSKVFKNEIEFQPETGKNTAFLTIELVDAPDTIILAADVLATTNDSYINQTLPNKDYKKSHTWKFDLSKATPRPTLLVCLGSDASPAEISSKKLITYYTLP